MDIHQWQNVGIALIFVVIFLSGYWLSRAGKPYSVLVLAVHKLIAVGLFVYLVVTLVRSHRADALNAATLGAGAVTGVFFVGLIATGGILSAEGEAPVLVARVHQITPYLTALATAVTLYLLG